MTSEINGKSTVYSTSCSDGSKEHIKSPRYCQIAMEKHRSAVDSPHKGPLMRRMTHVGWPPSRRYLRPVLYESEILQPFYGICIVQY